MKNWALPLLTVSAIALTLLIAPFAMAQTVLPPPTGNAQADSRQDQIEELQQQLRQATADNEALQRRLNEAQREVTRLQGVVGELTAANNALSQPSAEGLPPPNLATAGNRPADTSLAGAPAGQGLSPAQVAATGQLGTAPAPSDSAGAFQNARTLMLAGHYAEAEVAYGDFLRDYATSRDAPNARYWLGYTQLARNNYTDAAATFVDYLRRYPNGENAPAAQVNLGMAFAGMGNNRQACSAFTHLPARSPQTVRDRAAREARALNCAA